MKHFPFLLILLLTGLSACTAWHQPNPYLPSRDGIEAGEQITVRGNENIYTIAHEHNVSMREMIVLNDLKPPFALSPGQSLYLPADGASFSGDVKAPAAAPLEPVEKNPLAPIEPPGVTAQPLEAPPQPQSNAAPVSAETIQPPKQATAATTAAPAAEAAVETAAPTMVWPVQGPILSTFGAKGPGLNNDGINISAPKGAPVVAAASGTVAYAGDEMKGFGNLVLIRHQGDWVTAYAHLDRVLVKKDSIVAQGDMIGTVGKTGNVATPQLHFETRQAGKPVDPAGVIKGSL